MIEVEKATKDFMQKQFEKNKIFTRMMEEQSTMLRNISHQIENLNTEISSLQTRISNTETYVSNLSDSQTSLINKMAAKPETTKENSSAIAVVRVCTIFTNETKDVSHAHAPHVTGEKVVSVGHVSTISAKKFKLPESTTVVPSKCAEIFRDVGDNGAFVFYDNNFDFENCNITEVIMFLQKIGRAHV